MENRIDKSTCNKVLMVGVSYKVLPGGMSSVIQYYEPYFERLRYVSTYCYTGRIGRLIYFFSAIIKIFFLLLFDWRLQIVHIHTAADGSFVRASIVIKLCRFFKKKIILHCHASRFKDYFNEAKNKSKIIESLNKADVLVVLSKSWKEWFTSIGIEGCRIEVLNNITAYSLTIENEFKDNKLHLLFLGLLGKRKGVFDILKSLGEHKEKFKDKLIFKIGGNTHEKELLADIEKYKIEDFVQYEGWVTGEKKVELLNWADAYILPSYNEGLPIGILEAMSYGCAIIASPVGGIPEVVKDHYNGIIVEPGNTEDIAKAILYLTDKQEVSRMSIASKAIVKNYLPNQVIGDLLCIYKRILE